MKSFYKFIFRKKLYSPHGFFLKFSFTFVQGKYNLTVIRYFIHGPLLIYVAFGTITVSSNKCLNRALSSLVQAEQVRELDLREGEGGPRRQVIGPHDGAAQACHFSQ
jgi:hypothetical protein